MSMWGDHKTTQPVAAPASAEEDLSSAAHALPPADVAAGARGIVPRAHDDSKLEGIYYGESNVSD